MYTYSLTSEGLGDKIFDCRYHAIQAGVEEYILVHGKESTPTFYVGVCKPYSVPEIKADLLIESLQAALGEATDNESIKDGWLTDVTEAELQLLQYNLTQLIRGWVKHVQKEPKYLEVDVEPEMYIHDGNIPVNIIELQTLLNKLESNREILGRTSEQWTEDNNRILAQVSEVVKVLAEDVNVGDFAEIRKRLDSDNPNESKMALAYIRDTLALQMEIIKYQVQASS